MRLLPLQPLSLPVWTRPSFSRQLRTVHLCALTMLLLPLHRHGALSAGRNSPLSSSRLLALLVLESFHGGCVCCLPPLQLGLGHHSLDSCQPCIFARSPYRFCRFIVHTGLQILQEPYQLPKEPVLVVLAVLFLKVIEAIFLFYLPYGFKVLLTMNLGGACNELGQARVVGDFRNVVYDRLNTPGLCVEQDVVSVVRRTGILSKSIFFLQFLLLRKVIPNAPVFDRPERNESKFTSHSTTGREIGSRIIRHDCFLFLRQHTAAMCELHACLATASADELIFQGSAGRTATAAKGCTRRARRQRKGRSTPEGNRHR